MLKFNTTSNEINSLARISTSFLESTIIPHLEYEAIEILRNADICHPRYYNGIGPEDGDIWHSFWLNEALHACDQFNDVGEAAQYLDQATRAAVNVLVCAASLRDAIDFGKAEEAAAMAMILVSDAVMGGMEIDLKDITEKHQRRQRLPYENGLGKKQKEVFEAQKKLIIQFASNQWKENPNIRKGEMARMAADNAFDTLFKGGKLGNKVGEQAARKWIDEAGKQGAINIPPGASKAGKPRKAI